MKFLYDIAGADANVQKIPVRQGGTTPLNAGVAVMRGVTANTNQGAAIVAAGALADIIGVLEAASSATDYAAAGTALNLTKALVNPMAVYLAEYDQTSVVTATSGSSGTTINCTSIENISQGWIYGVGGTGPGELMYVVSGSSNTLTVKTAPVVAQDSTSTFIKILPKFHELIALNTTADKLASQAAAGSGAARNLGNFFRYNGQDLVELDPTKHDAITGLNSLSVHFYSAIMFLDHALNVSA